MLESNAAHYFSACAIASCRYRFAEMRYLRGAETRKGRVIPARVETVVLFLPDVWTCAPTLLAWPLLVAGYREQMEAQLTQDDSNTAAESKASLIVYSRRCSTVVGTVCEVTALL